MTLYRNFTRKLSGLYHIPIGEGPESANPGPHVHAPIVHGGELPKAAY